MADLISIAEESSKKVTRTARRRMRGDVVVRASIKCHREAHTILLTSRGRLVLLDHPDRKAEEATIALGGEKPACLNLLYAWRQGTEIITCEKDSKGPENSLISCSRELRRAQLTSLAVGRRRRHGIFPSEIRATGGGNEPQQPETLKQRLLKRREKKSDTV